MSGLGALKEAMRALTLDEGGARWLGATLAAEPPLGLEAALARVLYARWFTVGAALPLCEPSEAPREPAFVATFESAFPPRGPARLFVDRAPFALVLAGRRALPRGPRLRLYFHLEPGAAVAFAHGVAALLAGSAIPWRLKVPDAPAAFARCDAVVLYAPADRVREVAAVREALVALAAPALAPSIPCWTLGLAPGVGAALDDGGRASFGEARCGALARALLCAGRDPERGVRRRPRERDVVEALAREGVSIEHPFAPDAGALAPLVRSASRRLRRPAPARDDDLRSAAMELARGLAEEAIALGEGVGWLSPGPWQRRARFFAPVGPRLYDGLAGIALFLALAARCCGARELGALACSAHHGSLDALGEPRQRGFVDGWPGVVWAAYESARSLGEAALASRARAIAKARVGAQPSLRASADLVGGAAGDLWGAFAVASLFGEGVQRRAPRDAATEAGPQPSDAVLGRGLAFSMWPAPSDPGGGIGHGPWGPLALCAFGGGSATHGPSPASAWLEGIGASPHRERALGWCNGALGRFLALRSRGGLVSALRREADALAATPSPSLGLCHGLGGWLVCAAEPPLREHLGPARVAALHASALRAARKGRLAPSAPGLFDGAAGLGLGLLAACGAPLSPWLLLQRSPLATRVGPPFRASPARQI